MRIKYQNELEKLMKQPLFNTHDARKLGISASQLCYYVKIGLIERIGRGVYRNPRRDIKSDFRWEDLIIVSKSVPNGVICLVSALAVYNMTDEIPRQHWIAIPHSTTAPKRQHSRFIRMRDIETGRTKYHLGNEVITIFDPERTVVDAFRYLSKEIAIKALKKAVKNPRKFNMKKFQSYAKKFKLNLTPYIIAVTT